MRRAGGFSTQFLDFFAVGILERPPRKNKKEHPKTPKKKKLTIATMGHDLDATLKGPLLPGIVPLVKGTHPRARPDFGSTRLPGT